jgi:hypothetical protein
MVPDSMMQINFINLPNPPAEIGPGVYSSSKTETKMFLWSRARPVRGADNLTAICEPTVYTMFGPQHLTILRASTALLRGQLYCLCLVHNTRVLSEPMQK